MQTLDAIHTRTSIRAFLDQPVPKTLVERVLEASRWAPTGVNRQGWRVTAVTGDRCKTLSARLAERAREKMPQTPGTSGLDPDVRRRSKALMDDFTQIAEAQEQSLWEFVVLGSYRLYDAPVAIVVSHDGKRAGAIAPFVTTMLLAAHDLGLGTCWLGYPVGYADLIRETLDIPEEERIGAVVGRGDRAAEGQPKRHCKEPNQKLVSGNPRSSTTPAGNRSKNNPRATFTTASIVSRTLCFRCIAMLPLAT